MMSFLSLRGVIRFVTSREGQIMLALLAFGVWTQWQRMDAASDAKAELQAGIAVAVAEEKARWAIVVSEAEDAASDQASEDRAELDGLRGIRDELITNQVGECVIPSDVLDRLRAIY